MQGSALHTQPQHLIRWQAHAAINGVFHAAVTADGQEARFAAEEAAALVLAHLKQVAQEHFGPSQPVQRAVIAVPASFNAYQRQALCNAARIAGLEVLRLVHETSAAAMAYTHKLKLFGDLPEGESNVIVFSLGAEHLEVSLATSDDGILEVKAVAFDDRLGGRHFDDRVLAHLEAVGSRLPWIGRLPAAAAIRHHDGGRQLPCTAAIATALLHWECGWHASLLQDSRFNPQLILSPRSAVPTCLPQTAAAAGVASLSPRAKQRLRQAAERAKRELSAGSKAHVAVEALQGDRDLACSVSRVEFESACLDLFSRCLDPVEEVS